MAKTLIDGSYLLNRCVFVESANLSNDDGLFTGGIYVFLASLFNITEDTDAIITLDESECKWRKELYPDYKADRRHRKEELSKEELERQEKIHTTRDLAKKILPTLGIPLVKLDGWEGDDVLFRLAEKFREMGEEVTVVSDDSDYFQFVLNGTKILRPMAEQLITFDNFKIDARIGKNYMDFDPHFFTLYLAMVGTHNRIKGIPGIGPVRAKKIIQELEVFQNQADNAFLDNITLLDKWVGESTLNSTKIPKYLSSLIDNFNLLKLNIQLIDLKNIPLTSETVYNEYLEQKKNMKPDKFALMSFFDSLQIQSLSKWIERLDFNSK